MGMRLQNIADDHVLSDEFGSFFRLRFIFEKIFETHGGPPYNSILIIVYYNLSRGTSVNYRYIR